MGGADEKEKQRVRKKVKGKSVGGTRTKQTGDRGMEREAGPARGGRKRRNRRKRQKELDEIKHPKRETERGREKEREREVSPCSIRRLMKNSDTLTVSPAASRIARALFSAPTF